MTKTFVVFAWITRRQQPPFDFGKTPILAVKEQKNTPIS